jgi:hypothetical protein
MENPKVVEQIENNRESVIISPDSDSIPGLRAGNRRITGLNPNNYYMIETEKDENGIFVTPSDYPKYVTDITGPGLLMNNDLGFITRISGGSINDPALKNFHTYKIREAAPFPNGTNFTYSIGGVPQTAVSVIGGTITISPALPGTIALEQLNTAYNNYEVMAVAVNPDALKPSSPFLNQTKKDISALTPSFDLEGAGTTVDYVFVSPNLAVFRVLTVIIRQPPGSAGFTITFTFNDQMGTVTPSSTVINRGTFNEDNQVTLTLVPPTGGGTWSNVEWSIGGIAPAVIAGNSSGNSLTINNSSGFWPILAGASFDVTVTARLNGVPYSSAPVTITVAD